jgi:hopanoid biosynthesis associated RND transporter like protein HpnN
MAGGFEAVVDRTCGRWVAWVVKRPGAVLATVAVLTVALGIYAARTMGVNADPRTLVDPSLPFQVRQRELGKTFHALADGILLVIDADSPSAAARTADALGASLGARTDLFSEVDVPGGGPFFARNALLYLTTEQLEELTDRLSRVQPFLSAFARDQSLVGIADLVRQALEAERQGRATGLDLVPVLDRVRSVVEAVADGRRAADPWGAAIMGAALPAEARQRIVAVRPLRDTGEIPPNAPELVAVRNAIHALELPPDGAVRVRITGEPVMNGEELLAVANQTWHVAVISTVLFTAAVVFALRSFRTVVALVASLLVSLIWSNGIAAGTVRELNIISAAFNVLIVGLGGEFGIHFAMRYIEVAAKGWRRADALIESAESIGGSLFSSAVTTSLGFFLFLLTDFTGVAQLGLISGAGMFASLASTLTVLPAVLALGPTEPTVTVPGMPPWLARLDRLPLRLAGIIRPTSLALGVGALLLLSRIHFDYNPVRLHDPNQESVAAFQELLGRSDTSPWTADLIAPSLAEAQSLGARVRGLPEVDSVRTILDWVPTDQDEKRETLATASYFVPEKLTPSPPRTDEERRAALARLAEEAGRARGTELGPAAARLRSAIEGLLARAGANTLAVLERDLVGSLPDQVRDLQRLMKPDTVRLEDLPPTLVRQMLAPDGRARVQVLPKDDVSDGRALERFVAAVRAVVPAAAGLAVYVVEWCRVAWQAMLWALIGGVVCMALFLVVLWRSVWDMLLAFFPLALAAVLTCASLVLLGEPFNFANVIVLPMLIGMSVDSGVHLVHRHRTDEQEDVLGTSTARAVFYAALTTMLSFGSLGLAPHRGIASIGKLLTIGVGLVLVCYVVVLPAVLEWDDRRRSRGQPGDDRQIPEKEGGELGAR